MTPVRSNYRRSTWLLFAALLLAGLYLEQYAHEMHVSKLLCFASLGAFARDTAKPLRWYLLGMVGLLWLMMLGNWYQYRNQHLVPIGQGAYRIENN